VTRRVSRRAVALAVAGLFLAGVFVAGCGGGDDDSGAKAYEEPSQPAQETLKIESGNFFFKPDTPTVHEGVVNLALDNTNGNHTLVFDDGKEPGFQLEVSGGGSTDAKKIELEPGKYVFYCDILGHRAQGMEGTLTVKG
jgi:plastocyanin